MNRSDRFAMSSRQTHHEDNKYETGSNGNPEQYSMARVLRCWGHVLLRSLRLLILALFIIVIVVGRSSSFAGIIIIGIVLLEGGVEVEKDEIGEGHGRRIWACPNRLARVYIHAIGFSSSTAKLECNWSVGPLAFLVDGEVE